MENKWEKEFEDLWKRVAGSEYTPESHALPSDIRESNVETIKFLKDSYSKSHQEWCRIIEVKEKNIQDLGFQVEEMKAHLAEMRQHYQAIREKLIAQELDTALKLEESQNLLKEQKKQHSREIKLLGEVLERTKIEIKNLQEQLAAKSPLEKKNSELRIEISNLKDSIQNLENSLGEAKKALQETVSELFAERKAKTSADEKIREFEKRVKDLQEQMQNMRSNWDAERKEWRELWDRERSVWETHRQEFAVWEERLRTERQAWTDKLKTEEQKELEHVSNINKVLKESSQWSEKVTHVLKLFALKGVELPSVFVSRPEPALGAKIKRAVSKITAMTLAGFVLMAGLVFWIMDYRSKPHFKLLQAFPVEFESPTSISGSEHGIWIGDWQNGIVLKDKSDFATLMTIEANDKESFRTQAICSNPEHLWILDMAQLRYMKKSAKDGKTLETVKTPGPAPQGIAFDGYSLWSFDAATGLFYRFSIYPGSGIESSFEIPQVKNIVSMQWVGSILWVLDARNYLDRFEFRHNGFKKISSQKMQGSITSFWVNDKNFWTLEKTKQQRFEIRKYKKTEYR